ncbi:uncharacterized protein LOC125482350, partial [Rhincodon typus]|uniref:uncharacterized protein LOC125482350 n=1 Tax=Rhincodon typus TaxID=259920 RepID=UPI00202F20F8
MQRDSRAVPSGPCRQMDSPIQAEDLMSDVELLPPSAPSSAPPSPCLATAAAKSNFGRSAPPAVARSLPSSPRASLATTSSEVTARLYSSLRASRELGAARFSPPPPPSSSSVGALTNRSKDPHARQPDPVLRPTASSWAGPGTCKTAASRPPKSVQFSEEAPGPLAPPGLEDPAVQAAQRLSKRAEGSEALKGGSRHISEMESVRSHLQNMLKLSQDLTCRVSPSSPVSKRAEDQRDDDSFESDCTSALL